jgi:hypothetical protein
MNRASHRENQLLLITGRLQGVPKICFNEQPVGTITANVAATDVRSAMQPNILKRMMRLKLVSETPLEVVSFPDVQRREPTAPELFAEDIDAFNGPIDCTNSV